MSEVKDAAFKIIDKLHDVPIMDLVGGTEGDHISYCTNQYDEVVEWRGIQIYHEDDMVWDEEKDDYERSVEEQIKLNLMNIRDKLNEILAVI